MELLEHPSPERHCLPFRTLSAVYYEAVAPTLKEEAAEQDNNEAENLRQTSNSQMCILLVGRPSELNPSQQFPHDAP